MPITGPVPDWLFSIVAAATVFTVMFDLGLAIVPGERPGRLLKGLFSVLWRKRVTDAAAAVPAACTTGRRKLGC
jgi:hypothetical protein